MATGEVIRRIRKSLGMTQTELGVLIRFSQPAVSGLERGGPASHDIRVLRLVARALGVPLAILVVESDREAAVDRRNFFRSGAFGAAGTAITSAVSRPEHLSPTTEVGENDVTAIAETARRIHELDLAVGGDRLCGLAAGQVRYVTHLRNSGSFSDEVGRSLTRAASEIMTATGWVHFDSGRLEEARRFYDEAANAANIVSDGIAAAHAFGNASHLMVRYPAHRCGSRLAVQYAQAASHAARNDGGPKVRALMAIREAEAYGTRGDRSQALAAISRAYRAYESTRGHDPDWARMSESELRGVTGKTLMWLGDYASADRNLQAAVNSSRDWQRECASWQVNVADNYIRSGDVARGCAVLIENFDSITGPTSTRLRDRIEAITGRVYTHASIREVRDFLGRRAELLGANRVHR